MEETYKALRRLMADMFGRMRSNLDEHRMTPPQMFLLRLLIEKGTTTPKELASRLGVTPGNITGLVSKLEAAGFVTRSRDNRDRRIVALRPTAKARRRMKAVYAAAVEGLMGAFEDWPTNDIKRLKAFLERLAAKHHDKSPR